MRLEDAKAIRNACLKNAKDLLQASKLILEKELPHIAYNLAALAMEEIGKASMVESNYLNSNIEEEVYDVAADDHVRKLFWAIWSPGFLRGKITVQQLESTKDLASIIHERRLRYLYVDPRTPSLRGQEMIPGEAEQLIALAEARHGLETSREIIDINSPEANDLKWFYWACKDVEKRKYIFSQVAIDKLAEFGSSKDWICWLKQVFEKHDKEMSELAQKELSRSKPDASEANAPKWKIRVRLESPSHSVRPKALAKWNKISDFIKLYPTDDKHEVICEFTLSKSYPIASLWQGGWLSSKLFAVALNIATRGFFWWHVDKDIERFYEDILDVETNTHVRVERNPRLAVNWQELRLTLREDDMPLVGIVFGYLARISEKKGKEAFESYAADVPPKKRSNVILVKRVTKGPKETTWERNGTQWNRS